MSLAASLISLRSTCLCWVIPLTLRTLRARSLFTTGASSQSRSCERDKKQCRSNGVFKCLSKLETKQQNSSATIKTFHYEKNATDNHSLSYIREYSAGSSKLPLCLQPGQRSPSNVCKTCGHAEVTLLSPALQKSPRKLKATTIFQIATCAPDEGQTGKRGETQGTSGRAKKTSRHRCCVKRRVARWASETAELTH